jgi:hypothetical protein
MGCCHSSEAVAQGVGRKNVFLLGRKNCGKNRLLQALGKKTWAPRTTHSVGDKESHNFSGSLIEKVSMNAASGGNYWETWLTSRLQDLREDDVAVWYMYDESKQQERYDVIKDIVKLCNMRQLKNIPLWIIINTKNPKAYTRYNQPGNLRLKDLEASLELSREDLEAARHRVKHVIRITLPDSGYRTGETKANAASKMDLLLAAIKGGVATSTGT